MVETKQTNYSNIYHNSIEYLILLNGSQCTVMFSLLPLLEWNENVVILTMPVRDKICRTSGMKKTSLNVILSNLTKKNFLYRVRNNVYMMNPKLIWYGDEKSRKEAIGKRDWGISKIV